MSEELDQQPVDSDTVAGASLIISYRALRLGLVLAVGMLAVSIVAERIDAGYLRGSISSYFYSPVRSIFVGALLVIGFSLVVIHVRHRWEETFLTLGGMLAIVVALVPTGIPECGAGEMPGTSPNLRCRPEGSPDELPDWVITGVWNNVLALVLVGLVALVLTKRFAPDGTGPSVDELNLVLAVYAVLLVAGGLLYAVWEDFREHTHIVAAFLTFGCVGVTAAMNGWFRSEAQNPKRYRDIYRGVVIGMLAVLGIGLALVAADVEDAIFWLEAAELVLFAVYWLAQTSQHWNEPTA